MNLKTFLQSRRYPLIIAIFIVVATAVSLIHNLENTRHQYRDLATIMGTSLLQEHLITRKWNSLHGGVYVPVTDKFKPNPYLEDPLRDITTTDGMRLTKVNPAYMTRLVSELLQEEQGIQIHLASLRPINPANIADPLEIKALEKFEHGVARETRVIGSGDSSVFMHIAPMKIEESCMGCHGKEQYSAGDIVGVINVSFSYAPFQKAIYESDKKIYATHLFFLGIGCLLIIGIFGDITRRRSAEETVRRNWETQKVLKQILQTSLEPIPLEDQLGRTLDLIFSAPWIVLKGKGCIFLVEDESDMLVMKAHRGFSGAVLAACSRVPMDRCICGKAASTRMVQFSECVDEEHEGSYDDILPHGHYCVPIISGENTLGVLNIYLEEGHRRDKDEEEFLTAVANTLAGLITRRKTEEKFLQLATAVEQAGEIIMITDARGTIEYVNPAFERVAGYSRDEVIGKNPGIFKSGRHGPAFYRDLWDTISRGRVWNGRFINMRKDGTQYHEETTISPIKDEAGNIVNYVAVKHDITQEVALENQLRHAQKMEAIGQLAGGVAHDFNNILTAITGYASFLKMKIEKDDPSERYVTQILDSSERGANLTRGLLAFSRKQLLNPRPVDMNSIVTRIGDFMTRIIGEDVTFHTEISDGELPVMADPGQIEQVLVNLATNARDAMPDGGVMRIKAEAVVLNQEFVMTHGYGRPGRYALVSATDTGFGMDETTRDKIFEPFFTKKEVGKGTGLGLAIVYGIIKQHDGYINVSSEPGKGSTFNIYLPIIDGKVEEAKKTESSMPLIGKETVLIAEDDGEVRGLIKDVLEKFGYRVIEAVDGEDAVIKFSRNADSIDLLILDVVMPKKNGKDTYDELKSVWPDIKTLFMSGYSADIINKKGLMEEGLHVLAKPVSPGELLKKVREALD